jgi:hypothetical protein
VTELLRFELTKKVKRLRRRIMGRIDKEGSNDKTLEKRHIKDMLRIFGEYEEVKSGRHKQYSYVQELFDAKGICKQNFHKYYRRYLFNNRDEDQLL